MMEWLLQLKPAVWYYGHLLMAACAFNIAGHLLASGRWVTYRFDMGRDERERSFNFYVVGLFIFGVALDMAMAAFPSAWQAHMAAIAFAVAAGLIGAGSISWRMVRRWR